MKTIESINRRIREGKAVVLTAAEIKKMVREKSPGEVMAGVDVVTCATFSPMCSSGAFLNTGPTDPNTKLETVTLDGVAACGSLAARDLYVGATERSGQNPRFGGAHVIHKLVRGEEVRLQARGTPTDCYPGSKVDTMISLSTLSQAYLYNPRNCYQNYNAATNSSDRILYTYMGPLKRGLGNLYFSGTGDISPLINDPELETLGMGSRIFFCGGDGYIAWEGTQSNPDQNRDPDSGLPVGPGLTLAAIGDLKGMQAEYMRPIFIRGYGISIYIGIGVAIPVLNEKIVKKLTITNDQIWTNLLDYATGETIGEVNYRDLLDGTVRVRNRRLACHSLTDYPKSIKIMEVLKKRIQMRQFLLTTPAKPVHPART